MCSTLDGNTSDSRANRDHLARLAKLLPDEDEVTVVGDCKLVDAQTLGQLLSAGFHFVSLLPDSYNLRTELVRAAWETEPDVGRWPLLGSHPGRRKSDPATLYRGSSVEAPFPVVLQRPPKEGGNGQPEGVPSVEMMRFLIVHSDSLAALFDAQLDARLTKEREGVAVALARINRKPASCEQDALQQARKAIPSLRFHHVELKAVAETRAVKRPTRGRPPKGAPAPMETVWTVSATVELDEAAVVRERQHASCFPLVTDHLETPGWDDVASWPNTAIRGSSRAQRASVGSRAPLRSPRCFSRPPRECGHLGL